MRMMHHVVLCLCIALVSNICYVGMMLLLKKLLNGSPRDLGWA